MKGRITPLVIAGYFLAVAFLILLVSYFWSRDPYAPEQPIAFSHQVHVSKVGLKCTHCHQTVEKSRFAGIPPLQTCMNCHKAVATDRPMIQQLAKYWEEKKPVPWKRVYQIPVRNYVYFSHKRHIKAGFDCSKCHGEVRVMNTIERQRKLEMGWCVSCHKANNAPTDCVTCHK